MALEEQEREEDFDDELDEDDEEDVEDADEDEEPAVASSDDDDGDASLEELLDQRAARRAADDDDDETDIMSLTSEPDLPAGVEPIPPRVIPIKDRQEFVCNRCHLVKARSQLADEKRGLCRDCV